METHYVNYKRNTANKNAGVKKNKKKYINVFSQISYLWQKN